MAVELLHVGFRNFVPAERVVAIMSPDSAPVRRLIQDAKAGGNFLDMTKGRKAKAVLIMDSSHVVVVAVATDTIVARLATGYEPARVAGVRSEQEPNSQ